MFSKLFAPYKPETFGHNSRHIMNSYYLFFKPANMSLSLRKSTIAWFKFLENYMWSSLLKAASIKLQLWGSLIGWLSAPFDNNKLFCSKNFMIQLIKCILSYIKVACWIVTTLTSQFLELIYWKLHQIRGCQANKSVQLCP